MKKIFKNEQKFIVKFLEMINTIEQFSFLKSSLFSQLYENNNFSKDKFISQE